jgi:small GTP-binding protein
MTEYERVVKVIVLGDSGVGKSAIVQRYTSNKFDDFYDTTIGIDFASRNVILDNIKAKIQIWDTAGQERFRSLTKSYMRGTRCAILIFDVCDRQTFLNIESWIGDLNETCDQYNVIKLLIGNKIDLKEDRVVSRAEADKYAKKHGMLYTETSAKTGNNIETSINSVVADVLSIVDHNPKQVEPVVVITPKQELRFACVNFCCT